MEDDRRKAPRQAMAAKVEFALDSHGVIEATGLDVSEFGVGFETQEPLTVALTFTIDGREITRRARLMRVVRGDDGGFVFGLEFLDAQGE